MSDEPKFMAVSRDDPAYKQTVELAQSTLDEFRALLPDLLWTDAYPAIKTELRSCEEHAFIWLTVQALRPSGFTARVFEIPRQFLDFAVGDDIEIPSEAVLDWMYHDKGTLHGGFSLRYQRELLPPEKRLEFDAHIGVTEYA